MEKIDYKSLLDKLNNKTYKYADVQHKLTKVAFDVVRFVDSEKIDGLWQIKKDDSGEYIVAMYDDNNVITADKENTNWNVIADSNKQNLAFTYKNKLITKMASNSLGVDQKNLNEVIESLPIRLEKNAALRKALINSLSDEDKLSIYTKFPELN